MMKITKLAIFAMAMLMFAPFLTAGEVTAKGVLSIDSLDVAESIINLAPSIARDLNPPANGAERTVTQATVTDEGNTRTYYIEGEDVYHNGRVLSTYWLRIVKKITRVGDKDTASYSIDANNGPMPLQGRRLEAETEGLIAALLNVVYDVADMNISHKSVFLNHVAQTESELLGFELFGVNNVCEHVDQNTFKLTITRHFDNNRPSYEAVLTLPYAPNPEETPPVGIPVR